MVYIQEIDLFDMGILYGVIGEMRPSQERKLFSVLDHSRCTCLLCCFRGLQDKTLIEALARYARNNRQIRLVVILNEKEAQKAPLSAQKELDLLYNLVDMILLSTWPTEDLPLSVAAYSDITVMINDSKRSEFENKVRGMSTSQIITI